MTDGISCDDHVTHEIVRAPVERLVCVWSCTRMNMAVASVLRTMTARSNTSNHLRKNTTLGMAMRREGGEEQEDKEEEEEDENEEMKEEDKNEEEEKKMRRWRRKGRMDEENEEVEEEEEVEENKIGCTIPLPSLL